MPLPTARPSTSDPPPGGKATIMLTDGYIESQYEVPQGNVLWGVVNNSQFVPRRGKVLHIQED